MNKFRLSLDADSLEDSCSQTEADRLRDEVKRKSNHIEEQSKIILVLRNENNALKDDLEVALNNERELQQRYDNLKANAEAKKEELEVASEAYKHIETANEILTKRLESRVNQLQKYVDDLAKAKKDLDETKRLNEDLEHKNELLTIELDAANSRKRSLRERERQDDNDALNQEVQDLRSRLELFKQKNEALVAESQKMKQHYEEHERNKFVKDIEELQNQICQLKQLNENLTSELKNANSKKHSFSSSDREQTNEEMVQELYDLRAQVKSLSHRQSRRSIDEEILKLKQELEVTETSWKLERQHKERYARENCQLDRKVNLLTKELDSLSDQYKVLRAGYGELERKLEQHPPPSLPPKSHPNQQLVNSQQHVPDENRHNVASTATIHFPVLDESGEVMVQSSAFISKDKRALNESSLWDHYQHQQQHQHDFRTKRNLLNNESISAANNYCPNHRIQKSQLFNNDPIVEQRLRQERANELARRNMLSKPLHQTSYPLELDTFDTTDLTETEIKRGRVNRQALADFSNQSRKPTKKAEAFIV